MALTEKQAIAKVVALYDRLQKRRRPQIRQHRHHTGDDRTSPAVYHGIDKLLDYYRGNHPLAYATPEWRAEHADRFRGFSDNWCGVVGSAPGERRAIDGFRVGDDAEVLTAEERQLWQDWQSNEMPGQASQGFLMSDVARRSFVIVWDDGDDDGVPLATWEHPGQVIIDYDPGTRRKRFMLKVWADDDRELATLYSRDELWKFERSLTVGGVVNGRTESGLYVDGTDFAGGNGGWVQRSDLGDEPYPLPNPLDEVPGVEFANRPMLGGSPISDIDGTVAMQDAINLLWAYLFAAADFASMPARVIMGESPPKVPILDELGQKIGERTVEKEELTRGRMLWLTGQNTKVGGWDAAKLDVFTDVINIAVKHVAAQTRTPIHYIVGELGNVNGETLTATETPLAMKVRESHNFYTPRVRDVFRLMAKVRGEDTLAESCRQGIVQWRDPETRGIAQLADAALKAKSIGFPLAWIAEKTYGLEQTEIDRLMGMVEAERSDPMLQALIGGTTPPVPTDGPPANAGGS